MANPRTIRLPGSGADTQQYELAPGLAQYVQAVYVEVDNSGGGDARPTLTLSEQSGVVIAKKRQGETIPAGGTGSATWALRLADESAAAASSVRVVHLDLQMRIEGASSNQDFIPDWLYQMPYDPSVPGRIAWTIGGTWTTINDGDLVFSVTNYDATAIDIEIGGLYIQRLDVFQHETLIGDLVSIPGFGSADLTITDKVSGSNLLDLSGIPRGFSVAGTYAVSANIVGIPA